MTACAAPQPHAQMRLAPRQEPEPSMHDVSPATTLSADLLARFAAIVGERHAVVDPAALEPWLTEGRGLYHGRTSLLLRPGTVGEVAAILRLASETSTAIVPQGGNTGLVG